LPRDADQIAEETPVVRRILHLDMDAFYAAVEQADNPEYHGKPVIVGGSVRGVVAAASYEARRFGVRSAMPVFQAKKLCPQGIYLPVRMSRYKEVSRQVMDILEGISPLVEQVSIDEAFADITGTEALHGPPAALASEIKAAVKAATALTCSIGIAPNKFLAKIASDWKKPDGLVVIGEEDVAAFLGVLPVSKIPGVGEKTAAKMLALGVRTASDMLRFPADFWTKRFGKWGTRLYEKALGIDLSPVVPDSEPKSVSAEETFAADSGDMAFLEKMLMKQAQEVGSELRKAGLKGRTVTLKLRFSDLKIITRSRTLTDPFDSTQQIFDTGARLLRSVKLPGKVRLIGIGMSNFSTGEQQLKIFGDPGLARHERLDKALDAIHERFGDAAVKRGRLFDSKTE
jgi:DNA polymerase IV